MSSIPDPDYTKAWAALALCLDAYAAIDEMLDVMGASLPEGLTPAEKRLQRASNRARDRALKCYLERNHANEQRATVGAA
jgi:hypothetical protein